MTLLNSWSGLNPASSAFRRITRLELGPLALGLRPGVGTKTLAAEIKEEGRGVAHGEFDRRELGGEYLLDERRNDLHRREVAHAAQFAGDLHAREVDGVEPTGDATDRAQKR